MLQTMKLKSMMKIMESTMTTMTIMMMMMLLNYQKNTPFECEFCMMSSARKSFSIQFLMMFLIFDMEILIILPMMSTKMINLKEWMMYSMLTIMILMLGLIHEWNNGTLEWSK